MQKYDIRGPDDDNADLREYTAGLLAPSYEVVTAPDGVAALETLRAGEVSAIQGLDAGSDDYLIKPSSSRELLAGVRTHIELEFRTGIPFSAAGRSGA